MKNRFSTKNSKLYKMKCINSRNEEYEPVKKECLDKTERFKDN